MTNSELIAANNQICELQRLMGKKTMKSEVLKEVLNFGRTKNGLRIRPCCQETMDSRQLPEYGVHS